MQLALSTASPERRSNVVSQARQLRTGRAAGASARQLGFCPTQGEAPKLTSHSQVMDLDSIEVLCESCSIAIHRVTVRGRSTAVWLGCVVEGVKVFALDSDHVASHIATDDLFLSQPCPSNIFQKLSKHWPWRLLVCCRCMGSDVSVILKSTENTQPERKNATRRVVRTAQ